MKTRIVIQTCPGRERFLNTTIKGMLSSGLPAEIEGWTTFVDGHVNNAALTHGAVGLWDKPQGNLKSFIEIMRNAYRYSEPGDRILFFEDDLSFCKNAIARMLATGVPDACAFTSFFDMKEFFPGTPSDLYRVPLAGIDGRGFWGLQAVLFPHETVQAFLESPIPMKKTETLKSHSDMVLVDALQTRYDSYAAHVPCLVQHEGADASAIWGFSEHEINRRATNYRERLDAATLPVYGKSDHIV